MSDEPERVARGQPPGKKTSAAAGGVAPKSEKIGAAGEACPPWYIRYKGVIIILGAAILLIFAKWIYLRTKWGDSNIIYKDPMNAKVVEISWLENCCSWWPISHFVLFFILGFLYPELWWVLILLGALWELFEVVMAALTHKARQPIKIEESQERIQYSGNWWAGSFKDMLANAAGALLGAAFRLFLDHALGESRDKCGRVVLKRGYVDHSLSLHL